MYKELSEKIKQKLEKHHELYRFPCKAEQWEDIFDQIINSVSSNWIGGGHSVGADVISENNKLFPKNTRIQNKSGELNFEKGIIKWNGHRTTKHKTLDDKLNFISSNHYDYYAMLARDKKDWKLGNKIYYLIIFKSNKIDYLSLEWGEKYGKLGNLTGWNGIGNTKFSAEINKSMSDQLWTTSKLDYLGETYKIHIK
tara:strand:+ start:221 stop:811 length:591 start_codon:yes stop_codon:yes gene_type:complete